MMQKARFRFTYVAQRRYYVISGILINCGKFLSNYGMVVWLTGYRVLTQYNPQGFWVPCLALSRGESKMLNATSFCLLKVKTVLHNVLMDSV